MKRYQYDPRTPDFIWNKNRLALEKEAIKRQMMSVIKKQKKGTEADTKGTPA